MNKALVILSGGQDSTTCLYWAINRFGRENVEAVSFYYGQKHSVELQAADWICKKEGIKRIQLDMELLNQLAPNALTREAIKVDEEKPEGDVPNTFVPGRNLLFLNFAACYAYHHDFNILVTGVCQTDFSGYPDCRNSFINSAQTTISLALDKEIEIMTPLMWLNKAQTWELAYDLGCLKTVYEKTVTCYNGIAGEGCGKCPACGLRNAGFNQFVRYMADTRDIKIKTSEGELV